MSLGLNQSAAIARLKIALAVFLFAITAFGANKNPYSDLEMRSLETSDELKVRQLRNEEITQLRIALGLRAGVNRRADLYLRLAEIDLESYHQEYILEGRVHEKRLQQGVEDHFIDHSHSQPYLAAGIKACKEILSFGIPYPKLDQVYYFLAFNYGELGDKHESLGYYTQIIDRFPESQYVGEAYRELGDDAYFALNFRKAQSLYELAVKHSTADTLPRVQHKLAWSYYRTKQYDRAVETMKQAIASATSSGERFLNLREEALRDMAIFMTETGHADEAINYFQSVSGDKSFYPKVLEKLGKQYERNVEPVKATQVYESLMKTHPGTEEGFRVLVKLVDLDLRRGHYKEALGRLNGSPLVRDGDSDTQTAAQNLKAMVRRTATEHHEAFRKKGAKEDLEIAESFYTAYLNLFLAKNDPRGETPEIQMYLAEVDRELGKSREASDLYRSVVDSRDKRYAKEAGALWTASLAEAIKKDPTPKKPGEPSDLEKQYVDAADRLQDALGDTSEGREAALKAAEVLAGYKESQKDAISRIRKLIERSPKSPQALTAAKLWVQIVAEDPAKQDDRSSVAKELSENVQLMAADQEIGKGKLKQLIKDEDVHAKISTIAREEKENNYPAAARNYEAFAKEATQKDVVEKAYASAVFNYSKAEDPESIDRVATDWYGKFAKSAKANESVRAAATHFLIEGRFNEAAQFFERVGRDGSDPDSLETAARIDEGAGNIEAAQGLWTAFLGMYPQNSHRFGVSLALAKSQLKNGLDSMAVKSFQFCASNANELSPECGCDLGDYYLSTMDRDNAKIAYKKIASELPKKKGETLSPYVSYARYKLADLMESEAHFDPMALPEDRLKAALNQRLQFLEQLSRAYLAAVDAGGPWAIAALNRQALWVSKFADEIDQIQPPADAKPELLTQFKKNLDSVSVPLRKKAISTWQEGYNKAVTAESYSPALPEIADNLADAKVANPQRAQLAHGKFFLAGMPANGADKDPAVSLKSVRDKLEKNPQDTSAWVDYGNLLWGEQKPLLARLAYDRALGLNPKNAAALNNRAVVLLSGEGEDNWFTAAEGAQLISSALSQDELFLPAKANRATLLTYYRLFPKAKNLWEQAVARSGTNADLHDGLGVALQGTGNAKEADSEFKKASVNGSPESRFVSVYNEAARASMDGNYSQCITKLSDLDSSGLLGFEKSAVDHLKRSCAR